MSDSENQYEDVEHFEDGVSEELDEEKKRLVKKPKKLKSNWRFWHEKVADPEAWKNLDHLNDLCEFGTVQEFWSCFNNLPSISCLKVKESYHLMKNVNNKDDEMQTKSQIRITPTWEDPLNKKGGEWVFRIGKDHGETVWRELVLAIIGEQFLQVLQTDDEICGVSVSVRPTDYVFKIWNKLAGSEEPKPIFERTKEILRVEIPTIDTAIISPYYKKHE
ncbi:hypothetical protein ABK040_004745 [Willaertia magna]